MHVIHQVSVFLGFGPKVLFFVFFFFNLTFLADFSDPFPTNSHKQK